MLIVLLAIFIIIFFVIDTNFNFGILFALLLALVIITGIAHIITVTIAVYHDAKKKQVGAKIIWTILTFLFGFPITLLYMAFTLKCVKHNNSNKEKKSLIFSIISICLMIVFIISANEFVIERNTYETTHFTKNDIVYKNNDGNDVVYDKMGNAYTREEMDNFKYYTKNGKSYTPIWDYDIFSNVPEIDTLICNEDGTEQDSYYFIDKDGYLVITNYEDEFKHSSLGVAYKDEVIYYYLSSCFWTPEGELTFNYNNGDYDKITYNDIINKSNEEKQLYLEDTIRVFFEYFNESDWESISYQCASELMNNHFNGKALLNLESVELIKKLDEGYIDNDKNRYYLTSIVKCKPNENSNLYDTDNEYVTTELTIILEYNTERYEDWIVSEIRTNR